MLGCDMTLEESFKYRSKNLELIEDLIRKLDSEKGTIKTIVIGVLYADDSFRVKEIGPMVDRFGLVTAITKSVDEGYDENYS